MLLISVMFAIVSVSMAQTCPTLGSMSVSHNMLYDASPIAGTDTFLYLSGYGGAKDAFIMNTTTGISEDSVFGRGAWVTSHVVGITTYISTQNIIFVVGPPGSSGLVMLAGIQYGFGSFDGPLGTGMFSGIKGITSSATGEILYVTDAQTTPRIRTVNTQTGYIATLTVSGSIAITDIGSISRNGNELFFVDGRKIYKIGVSGGIITHVVGCCQLSATLSTDGLGEDASFGGPIKGFAFTSESTVGMPIGSGIVIAEDSTPPRIRWFPLSYSGPTQTLMVARTNGTEFGNTLAPTMRLSDSPHLTSIESVFVHANTVYVFGGAYNAQDELPQVGAAIMNITAPFCGVTTYPSTTPTREDTPGPCQAGYKHPNPLSDTCLACGKNSYRHADNTNNECTVCAHGTGTNAGVVNAPDAGHCKNLTRSVNLPVGTTPEEIAVERSSFRRSGPENGIFANKVTVNTSQIVLRAADIESMPQSKSGIVRVATAFIDMQPSGLMFPDGVLIKIQLPDGLVVADYIIHYFDEPSDTWIAVETFLCDAAFQFTACATVYHFTGFATLAALPGATEPIRGAKAPGVVVITLVAEFMVFILAVVGVTAFSNRGKGSVTPGAGRPYSNNIADSSRDWHSLLRA